jgi:hypothetical protein
MGSLLEDQLLADQLVPRHGNLHLALHSADTFVLSALPSEFGVPLGPLRFLTLALWRFLWAGGFSPLPT